MNERGKCYVVTITFDWFAVIERMMIFFSTIVNNYNENRCSMMSKPEGKFFFFSIFVYEDNMYTLEIKIAFIFT